MTFCDISFTLDVHDFLYFLPYDFPTLAAQCHQPTLRAFEAAVALNLIDGFCFVEIGFTASALSAFLKVSFSGFVAARCCLVSLAHWGCHCETIGHRNTG